MTPSLLHPLTLAICFSLLPFLICETENNEISFVKNTPRNPKFLNLITWVQFENTECAGSTGDNGTCFTTNECAEIGGTADGSWPAALVSAASSSTTVAQRPTITRPTSW